MVFEQLKRSEESVVKAVKPKQPVFVDTSKIPWTPWVIEGTHFKLLRVNEISGGWTMLLKVDAGNDAPVHGHTGAAEAYIVEGEFGYGDDRGGVGCYAYEPAGAVHEPDSPKGSVMFAVIHGPLVGYNPDGSTAAVVDGKVMLQLAQEGNAADHLNVAFDR